MSDGPSSGPESREGLGAVGLAIFAVTCCAGVPLVAAIAGGVAAGVILGAGAGALAVIGLVVLVALRARNRRACKVEDAGAPGPWANGAGDDVAVRGRRERATNAPGGR